MNEGIKRLWNGRGKWMVGLALVISLFLVTFGAAEFRGMAREAKRSGFSVEAYRDVLKRMDSSMGRIRQKLDASAPALELGDAPAAQPATDVMPTASVADRVSALRLDGVAWNPQAPVAFINGDLVMVETTIEGLRVTLIEEERVRFADEKGNTADILLYEKPATEGGENDG